MSQITMAYSAKGPNHGTQSSNSGVSAPVLISPHRLVLAIAGTRQHSQSAQITQIIFKIGVPEFLVFIPRSVDQTHLIGVCIRLRFDSRAIPDNAASPFAMHRIVVSGHF